MRKGGLVPINEFREGNYNGPLQASDSGASARAAIAAGREAGAPRSESRAAVADPSERAVLVYKEEVGHMETTYVSMTNSPTNQPNQLDPPDSYVSIRVTTKHHFWNKVQDCLDPETWYISWKEHGKSGENPHFHVLVPGSHSRDCERIRKRLKIAGYSGNRELSVKLCQNGLLQGIQYCGKEGPPHSIGGDPDVIKRWIDAAPVWEPKQNVGNYMIKEQKKPRNPDHFLMITYQNLERVSIRYHKEHGIASDQLEQTLAAMHKDGWRLSVDILRRGLPQSYYDQFTATLKDKTIFTANRFLRMRIPENWN